VAEAVREVKVDRVELVAAVLEEDEGAMAKIARAVRVVAVMGVEEAPVVGAEKVGLAA
jgi:hypothetical protein